MSQYQAKTVYKTLFHRRRVWNQRYYYVPCISCTVPFIYLEHIRPVFCERSTSGVLHRLINRQQPPPRVLWQGLHALGDEITVYNIRTALMNYSMEMSLPRMPMSSSGLSMPLHLCVCQQKIPLNRLAKRLCTHCKQPNHLIGMFLYLAEIKAVSFHCYFQLLPIIGLLAPPLSKWHATVLIDMSMIGCALHTFF